jgi:hypothetical protein
MSVRFDLQGEEMLRTLFAAVLALAVAGPSDAGTPPTVKPSQVNARNIGMCETYDPNDPYNLHNGAGANSLTPQAAIYAYVESYQKSYLMELKPADYSVKYVKQPEYGVIESVSRDGEIRHFYVPSKGYKGNDRYVAEVSLKGIKFKVTGFLRPSADVRSDSDHICRRLGLPGAVWEISGATDQEVHGGSIPPAALAFSNPIRWSVADLVER